MSGRRSDLGEHQAAVAPGVCLMVVVVVIVLADLGRVCLLERRANSSCGARGSSVSGRAPWSLGARKEEGLTSEEEGASADGLNRLLDRRRLHQAEV